MIKESVREVLLLILREIDNCVEFKYDYDNDNIINTIVIIINSFS